jgi:hypothetical protein
MEGNPSPFNRIVQEFGLCVHLQRMLLTAILTPIYRNPIVEMLPSGRAWDRPCPIKRQHFAKEMVCDYRKSENRRNESLGGVSQERVCRPALLAITKSMPGHAYALPAPDWSG